MSQAEVVRSLKIKTNTLKRLHKELTYYCKETDREQARVEQLKAGSADQHDLRQAVRMHLDARPACTRTVPCSSHASRCAHRRMCWQSQP